jgi:hypothetical protein
LGGGKGGGGDQHMNVDLPCYEKKLKLNTMSFIHFGSCMSALIQFYILKRKQIQENENS